MAKKKNKKKLKKQPRKQIKDNYSFKEMDISINGMIDLLNIYSEVKHFGFNNSQFDQAIEKFDVIDNQYKVIKHTPDRFNHFFAKKGWLAFESLNFTLMQECVKLAEEGKPNEAEDALINYFTDRESINFLVTRLTSMKEFRPRRSLMLNALEDHFSGRYHASVPLFLMLIDGFVNEFENFGFFAEKVDLNVWDTIAAHESGLGTIAKIFGKSRKKTTIEELALPYRNGILHGRDLGYANVKVSAKALSTLLALRDWADSIIQGKKEINKEFIPPTLEQSAEQLAISLEGLEESRRQRVYMDEVWQSRNINVGVDIPFKGDISDYVEDTPEKAVVQLISFISSKNYGKLASMLEYDKSYETVGKLAGTLRGIFKEKILIDYKLVSVTDNAPAICEVEAALVFKREEDGKCITDYRKFRLMYMDDNGNFVPYGYKKAEWKFLFNFRDIEYINFDK